MRKLIYKYLSENYFVRKNLVLYKDHERDATSITLVKELKTIFGLTKKQLKWYIKGWICKQNKGFEFNNWWAPNFGLFFPFVSKVVGRTIGTDLVDVRPMGEPTGQLAYINWTHDNNDVLVGEYHHPTTRRRQYLDDLINVVNNMRILEFPER